MVSQQHGLLPLCGRTESSIQTTMVKQRVVHAVRLDTLDKAFVSEPGKKRVWGLAGSAILFSKTIKIVRATPSGAGPFGPSFYLIA